MNLIVKSNEFKDIKIITLRYKPKLNLFTFIAPFTVFLHLP